MIDAAEHVYADDPACGHPDVRTRLRDASYFFLGNGHILAAVQWSPSGEGTPLGLLISDPDRLGPKRACLTLDETYGLEPTRFTCTAPDGRRIVPADPSVTWSEYDGIPVVTAEWQSAGLAVTEHFLCPDSGMPVLHRYISIRAEEGGGEPLLGRTAAGRAVWEAELVWDEERRIDVGLVYTLDAQAGEIALTRLGAQTGTVAFPAGSSARRRTARVRTGSERLDRFFAAAAAQLPAVVSASGRVDASIWQYHREWVRDHAAMAVGLVLAGRHDRAGRLLERLCDEFVTPEGDTIDSSERRSADEVELDQNGALLHALATWMLWTGETGLIEERWERIVRVASYPFTAPFRRDPPGLLANRREYWERHALFGIESGFELSYQTWNVIGLQAAAVMAAGIGEIEQAAAWGDRAERLLRTVLEDPQYALHDERGFIKRRALDGAVQETITPPRGAELAPGIGLLRPGEHPLNPDSAAALPIAFELVDPLSPLADATMAALEQLWNQDWNEGGYARYHIAGEADQPGSWPFPSLFIARAALERAEYDKVERILAWLDTMPGAAAGSWFETYAERLSPPGPQVGIPPWTWAEMIVLVVHHLLGVRPTRHGIVLRPRLLPGMREVDARLCVRGHTLELGLRTDASGDGIEGTTDGRFLHLGPDEVLLAWPGDDVGVLLHLPDPDG